MVIQAGEMGRRIYFIFEGKVEVQIPDIQGDIKSVGYCSRKAKWLVKFHC